MEMMDNSSRSENNILLYTNKSTFMAGFILCIYSFLMYVLFIAQSPEQVNFYSVPPIITSVLYFAFGYYIFQKNSNSPANLALASLWVCIAIWLSGYALIYLSMDYQRAL